MVSMWSSQTTIYSTILFLSLSAGARTLGYRCAGARTLGYRSAGALTLGYLSADAIFEDLIKWNKRCVGQDSCQEDRVSNNLGGFFQDSVNCHCDRRCNVWGTCCADSKYRTRFGLGAGFSCRNPNGFGSSALFMLDRCRRNWNGEDLCSGDAEASSDPLLLIPVTSPRTGITYRNYFCFACNEDFEAVSPVLWKLELFSESENVTGELLTNLQYDQRRQRWTIRGTDALVSLEVKIPEAFKEYEVRCEESVIHTCAKNWTDLVTQQKCKAYMALVWSSRDRLVYRNPHCAVCNFVNVSSIACRAGEAPGGALPPLIREFYLYLENRCARYEMYDPLSERCRRVRCGRNQAWYQGECRDRN